MFNFLKRNKFNEDEIILSVKNQITQNIKKYLYFDKNYVKSMLHINGSEIKSTTCHKNNSCHYVSMTLHQNDNNMKVVPCIITNENDVIAHFINYDSINGTYIDNTLGIQSNIYEYHILNCGWIESLEYMQSPKEALEKLKKDFILMFNSTDVPSEDIIDSYWLHYML